MTQNHLFPAWFYRFSGALATKFIGRENDLANIRGLLASQKPGLHVLQFTGQGGLGKTRFEEKTLELARDNANLLVASRLIDFYHFRNHSATELMRAILDVLPGEVEDFASIRAQIQDLTLKRVTVDFHGFRQQEKALVAAFNRRMQRIASRQRVVLAFDTLERMMYQNQEITTGAMQAESWDWLVQNASKWGNVTLLLAGREKAKQLFRRFEQDPHAAQQLKIEAVPFDKHDRLAYFAAAQEAAAESGADAPAAILRDLQEQGLVEKYATYSDRPIVFSLLLHMLCLGPVDVRNTDELEERVINALINTPRLGATVVALGRLPKGANADLLAPLLGVSLEEAQQRIDEVKDLSFIKRRKDDDRIFLHDEMYALLREHVYDLPADAIAADQASDAIDTYYNERVVVLRKQFTAPFHAIDETVAKDTLTKEERQSVVAALFERQTMLAEQLYYRLRSSADWGMRAYYRFMREALRSLDEYFSLQLQAELLQYQEEINAVHSEPEAFDALVDGMVLQFPVVRAIFSRQYEVGKEEAEQIQHEHPRLFALGTKTGLHASLQTWRADCLWRTGKADEAERLLKASINETQLLLNEWMANQQGSAASSLPDEAALKENPRLWYLAATQAMTSYILASLYWGQGRLIDSEQHYSRAQELWRATRVHIELATTENDLANQNSEQGSSADDLDWANDALALRWEYAPVTHIALSRNTVGIILMRHGQYVEAIAASESALRLANSIEQPAGRVTGLCCIALAESNRRRATYSGQSLSPALREELLRRALRYAERGREIFANSPEAVHLAAALIEVGCANRDLLRLYNEIDGETETVQKTRQQAVAALQQAVSVAQTAQNTYREVDALVNLAWLGYAASDNQLIENARGEADKTLAVYGIPDALENASGKQPEPLLWTLRSKLTFQAAQQMMDAFEKTYGERDPRSEDHPYLPMLREAAQLYTKSLEQSRRFHNNYPGLLLASRQLRNRLKKLNRTLLGSFVKEIHQFEADNQIEHGGTYLYLDLKNNRLLPQ